MSNPQPKFIMTRFATIVILLICGLINCYGASISGTVLDDNREQIAGANVAVISLPDSVFVAATTTDCSGRFEFTGFAGDKYIVTASCMGYVTTSAECYGSDPLTIALKENATKLQEVSIAANSIKHRASGYTVNLTRSSLPEGKGSLEMLGFLPLVSYDEGSLTVLSQKPYAIYVDGIKLTDQQQLEAIPASMIKSVDVAYAAGVNEASNASGAVIRIKLKKESDGGFTGNVSGRSEVMPEYGYTGGQLTGYIGLRKGKLSISNTGMYRRNKLIGDEENDVEYTENGQTVSTDDRYRNWSSYMYEQLNMAYEPDDKNTLQLSAFFSHSDNDEKLSSINRSTTNRSKIDSPSHSNLAHFVGNYNRLLNQEGAMLNVSVDYLHRHSSLNKKLTYETSPLAESQDSKQNTDLIRGKLETELPLGEGALSGGLDMQYAHHSDLTTRQATTGTQAGVWTEMDGYRPAVFSDYNGAIGNVQYEAGLRLQGNLTHVKAGGVIDKKHIWEVCPKLDIMYMINPEKESMAMLSYKRSVDELPYSVISSYRNYLSPLEYTTGNPGVKSPVNDELALVATYRHLTFSSAMFRVSAPLFYSTSADTNGVIANTACNGKHETMWHLSAEGLFPIAVWWKAKPSVSYKLYWADMSQYKVSRQGSWNMSIYNNLKFSKSLGGTLRANFEPESRFRNMKMSSVWSIRGSVYKTFMDNYLQLILSFTAYAKGRETTTTTPDYMTMYRNVTKSTSVTLKVVWYFRGGKNVKVNDNIQSTQEYHQYEIENGH